VLPGIVRDGERFWGSSRWIFRSCRRVSWITLQENKIIPFDRSSPLAGVSEAFHGIPETLLIERPGVSLQVEEHILRLLEGHREKSSALIRGHVGNEIDLCAHGGIRWDSADDFVGGDAVSFRDGPLGQQLKKSGVAELDQEDQRRQPKNDPLSPGSGPFSDHPYS